MDELYRMYSIGLMHEVALKAAKAKFTPLELHDLTEKEFRLIQAERRRESTYEYSDLVQLALLWNALRGIKEFSVHTEEWVREVMSTIDVPDSVMWRNNYKFTGTARVFDFKPGTYSGKVNMLAWHWTESEGDGQSLFLSLWVALPSGVLAYHFSAAHDGTLRPRDASRDEWPEWVIEWLKEQEQKRLDTKTKS